MKFSTSIRRLALVLPLLTLMASAGFSQVYSPVFTVDSAADAVDAEVGDGVCADLEGRCTLRAAVQEANAASGRSPVVAFALSYPAVIDLTLGEVNVIPGNGLVYYIVGPGARLLTVQRSPAAKQPFRVFNVTTSGPAQGQSMVRIRGLSIRNGRGGSEFPGGGVHASGGALLSLSRVALIGNSSDLGGAVAVEGSSAGLSVTQSLVASNSALSGGAASVGAGSRFAAINSTITNNAAQVGGAVYSAGTTEIVNSTVSHNSATVSASSMVNIASNPTFKVFNSIIGPDQSSPVTSLAGSFLSNGNNIITDARGSSGFVHSVKSDQVSDSNAIDPGLGDLADNGGPTDTRPLLPGSPAIDAGNPCIFTGCPIATPAPSYFNDQRLYFRQGAGSAPDIGAVESNGPAILGEFVSRLGSPRALFYGSHVVILDLETGEQSVVGVNPFGMYSFKWRFGGIYLLEHNIKRGSVTFRGVQERF